MGAIRANRHGMLLFDFYFRGIRCREGTKLADTPKNRKTMTAQMVVMEEEIARGVFDYGRWFPAGKQLHIFKPAAGSNTFQKYFERWLRDKYDPDRERNEIRFSTYRDYKAVGKLFLEPYFGAMALEDITPAVLKDFSRILRDKQLSDTRIKHVLNPLRAILSEAHDLDIIPANPYRAKIFGKLSSTPKHQIAPLSLKEIGKFLDKCPAWWLEYFVVAFYTGMRPSEQIALKWANVDLARGYFQIVESRSYNEEGRPKTAASVRSVKMTPAVLQAFKDQREKTFSLGPYVFLSEQHMNVNIENLSRRSWHSTLVAAELPARNLYQTRHTAITLMLMAGEDRYWVAQQTGTSVRMIEKHYFKYIPDMGKRDGDSFGKMIGQRVDQGLTKNS